MLRQHNKKNPKRSHEIPALPAGKLRPFGPPRSATDSKLAYWGGQDGQLKTRTKNTSPGQIFLEYILVVGAVVLVMFATSTLIKRGAQGMIKVVADQIGDQANADQQFDDRGFLESAYTTTRTNTSKIKTEFPGDPTTYTYKDVTNIASEMVTNLGFTEEN